MSDWSGEGKLHGLQAEPIQATFQASPRGLEVQAGEEHLVWDWKWLTIARGGFQDKMWVVIAEHRGKTLQLYVTTPVDFARKLLEQPLPSLLADQLRAAAKGKPSGCIGSWPFWITLLALLGATLWYGPRLLARFVAHQIPQDWERSLGNSSATQLLAQHGGACSAKPLTQPVQEITRRLLLAAGQKPEDFRVFVLNSEQINAMALPGGYLFVCRGLLQQAESPDELAGVLAHEIQHVLQRHGLSNVLHQAGVGVAWTLLLGSDSGWTDLIAAGAAGLGGLAFSRGQEEEADEQGVELLIRAGFDGRGLGRFFDRIAQDEVDLPALLSSHPTSQHRSERLAEILAELPKPDLRPLDSPWPAADTPCEPMPVSNPDTAL